MRTTIRGLLLTALAGYAAPALAEFTWIDTGSGYELTGAQLFALRAELPPELQESLKAVRNRSFPDEAAFRAALDAALATDALRAEWSDRLVEAAGGQGAAFGFEPREGELLTIVVAAPDHELDTHPFSSLSWLAALPDAAESGPIAAAENAGCLDVTEGNALLFSLCAPEVTANGTTVVLKTEAETVRGLGQEFTAPGEAIADRIGAMRTGLNVMSGFNGGANGNTLFPIAYFDAEPQPFALILDNRYRQEWDFTGDDFRLRVADGDLKLHVLTGDTLADIRRQYMAMTGTPPIPPKSAFGLWISEYGYDNWAELDDKIASLEANGFPLSGAILDLFWFGGIAANSPQSRMGSLTWDDTRFPHPAAKIAELKAQGIGIIPIEESYISAGLPEYEALAAQHALAHGADGNPLVVNPAGNWWGRGGMVDWLSLEGAAFWHDFRRKALIDAGVAGHWTDLGEPEMFSPGFLYSPADLPQQMVHNSYNLAWLESIADGYARTHPEKRPFMMSRSGGMGMQALGAVMWSGDTAGDFGSLAAQMPQQSHMMWSGLDYFGSDIGGFHRGALGVAASTDAALNDLYTQWFAYAAMFEVPVRPHTENLCNCKETAPDRIGDLESNRANIRLRYALMPYYYSTAYAAWRRGEPMFPTVDYWFPEAEAARELGHVKMIGRDLLSAAVASPGATDVEIYFPAGDWYDFRTGFRTSSRGETVTVPVYDFDGLGLPLYARDGAVVPTADGVIHVFGTASNTFEWYDDDGETLAYRHGDFEMIRIFVEHDSIELQRAAGLALAPRTLRWTRPDAPGIAAVTINGAEVAFTEDGGTITVELPVFMDEAVVTLH